MPKRPEPERLQHRGSASDQDGGENGPREIGFALAGGPHHDRREQNRGGYADSGELQAEDQSDLYRWFFVRLVAKPRIVRTHGATDVLKTPSARSTKRKRRSA